MIVHADCREHMRTMDANSVDAIVTDPPYELSSDGKASASRIALELMFPKNPKINVERSGEDHLPFFVAEILGLRRVGFVPRPAAAMPVRAVALHDDTASGQIDIEHSSERAIWSTDGERRNGSEAEPVKHLGDFALELTDTAALLNALNRFGCGFLAGGLGVGLGVAPASLPSLCRGGLPINDRDVVVRLRNRALTDLVGALTGATGSTVARFELGRTAEETLTTDGALMLCAALLCGGAKLVRTGPRTGGLPTMFESRRISIVDAITDRALSLNLIFHTQSITGNGFMGKSWDGSKIAYDVAVWREAYRVLKPGGYLLSFGGTRTFHRMAVAIEDAGFEIRDTLSWLYGSGFPKSHDVGKAIDKLAGIERNVSEHKRKDREGWRFETQATPSLPPATDAAKQWDGWGTALKPAWEPIIVARKPLEGTVAANVLTHGTGAINVDACRIEGGMNDTPESWAKKGAGGKAGANGFAGQFSQGMKDAYARGDIPLPSGRWPANVILDDEAAALLDAQSGYLKGRANKNPSRSEIDTFGFTTPHSCGPEYNYGDTGGASRFFLTVTPDEIPHDSGGFMVQYDCNCEATEGGEWASQDHQASILAASDTPPQRDITGSLSGTANEAAPSWPTSLSGNDTTAPSLMDSKSITETATSKTTGSTTCNCSIQSPTSDCTQDANSETASGGSRVHSAVSSILSTPITGTSAVKAGLSMGDASRVTSAESLPINSGDELRFRYTAKASRAERSAGLDTPSNHPTVKPISLMRWLVRLVTPPGGTVLDPFAGSGTTGCAAALEGFQFIGIERESEYVAIAERRIAHWAAQSQQLTFAEVAS